MEPPEILYTNKSTRGRRMTFLTDEKCGTNQQVSPAQLNARESTPKEPGLKNFEQNQGILWFL